MAEHVGRVTTKQTTPAGINPFFNRCRIGHSRLSHEFLLKGEPPPECIPCNCPLTIKHLLVECVDFTDVRQRFYQVPSLQDLFKTVKPDMISEFLKAELCAVQTFVSFLSV